MIIIDRRALRELNLSHRVLFHRVALERIAMRRVGVFPHNILVWTPRVGDGDGLYCPSSGLEFPFRRGGYGFVPCGLAVEYRFSPATEFMTFHFNLELHPGVDVFTPDFGVATGHAPRRCAFFRAIFDDPDDHRAWFRFQSAVTGLCAELWGDARATRDRRAARYEALFRAVERRCDAAWSVGEMARAQGMTQAAFSRRFKADLGFTPKQYLERVILREVMRRLKIPGSTLAGIAQAMRFSSEFQLLRFFKRVTGMTPGAFRAWSD